MGGLSIENQFKGIVHPNSLIQMLCTGKSMGPGLWLLTFFKCLLLCSAEDRNSYRFGTTWEWVHDDRIKIFWWTIPL